jgi:hypothetical protein
MIIEHLYVPKGRRKKFLNSVFQKRDVLRGTMICRHISSEWIDYENMD